MNPWDKTKPLPSEYLNTFFDYLRNLKEMFLDRFGLDHNMDGVNDTTLPTADGYHEKLTMPDFNYSDGYGGTLVNPNYITNSIIPYVKKINGIHELCVQNSSGIYKITNKGELSIGEVYEQETFVLPHAPSKMYYYANTYIIITTGGSIYTSTDGVNWTLRTSGWNRLYSLSYSGSAFVVTTGSSYILYSTNLITWTSYSPSSWGASYCSTYGAGMFLAICGNGRFCTSSDGINWTFRNFMTYYPMNSVTFYNGLFVAVGDNGKVAKSSDGINWTYATIDTRQLKSITAGNGKFIIVGGAMAVSSLTYYSTDAITWTAVNNVVLTETYNHVRYFERDDKKFFISTSSTSVTKSDDGITWSLHTSGMPTPIYYDIAFTSRLSLVLCNNNILKSYFTKIG